MQKKRRFFVGQCLDVLDTVNKWLNGQVLMVKPHQLRIHYTGWNVKFDEWIPADSERILVQWEPGNDIQLNNRLDVKHPIGGWLEARVIEKGDKQVKVHFQRYHAKFDMWVDLNDKERVAEIGRFSKAHGVGKKRSNLVLKLNEMIIEKLRQNDRQFRETLKSRHLVIKEMGADGNCLFRSISDQLYGNEAYHQEIRNLCMDYIQSEKAFFENYIAEDFYSYVMRKRENGQWGDDVEIQAISEIYNRPIEIFVNGTKPIKTFHEQNDRNIRALKLSYHGKCHYNSIKELQHEGDGLLDTNFGIYQKHFTEGQFKGREVSRDLFASTACLEQKIKLALSPEEERKQEEEIDKEIGKMCQTDTMLEEIDKAELMQVQIKEEQDEIKEKIRQIEAKQLEQVRKQSLLEARQKEAPWIQAIRQHGFSDQEITMGINCKGNDPDAVLNFLYDNF